uniref:Uncharacterized protein n=1 Tax=Helianthus annuus TaxID=4232 RepID=A0A251TTS5_HELAN
MSMPSHSCLIRDILGRDAPRLKFKVQGEHVFFITSLKLKVQQICDNWHQTGHDALLAKPVKFTTQGTQSFL